MSQLPAFLGSGPAMLMALEAVWKRAQRGYVHPNPHHAFYFRNADEFIEKHIEKYPTGVRLGVYLDASELDAIRKAISAAYCGMNSNMEEVLLQREANALREAEATAFDILGEHEAVDRLADLVEEREKMARGEACA